MPARLLLFGIGLVLFCSSFAAPRLLMGLTVFATGLCTLSLSSRRWSPVGFLCAAMILGLPIWSIATLAGWSIGPSVPATLVVLAWLAVCLLLLLFRRQSPLKIHRLGLVDYLSLFFMALVAVPVAIVWKNNGPHVTENVPTYSVGLSGGLDMLYFFGLAQEAASCQAYPNENPVFAGVSNKYASLPHCGVAGLSNLTTGPVAVTTWWVWPALLLAAVGLGFHAVYRLSRARTTRAILPMAMGYLAFLSIRIDHFITPQPQALGFGLLSLAVYYYPHYNFRWNQNWIKFTVIAAILVFFHTVSSTVAVALAACTAAMCILRRRYRYYAAPTAAFLLLALLFYLVNNTSPHQMDTKPIPPEYVSIMFWRYTVPYIFPFLVVLILVIVQKRLSPIGLTVFALVMLSMAYWSLGFSAQSHQRLWFPVFNGGRFGLFALWLSLAFYQIKFLKQTILTSILLLYTILFPNYYVRAMPEFLFAKPARYSMADVAQLHTLLQLPPGKSIMINGESFEPAAFSGSPLYITATSLPFYALDTVDEAVSQKRLREREEFFGSMSPGQRLAFMHQHGIGAVVFNNKLPNSVAENILPARTAKTYCGEDWTIIVPAQH